jgi:sulfoacetaldehyde acetyltransferase
MDHEADDPGTTWNQRAKDSEPEKMTVRMAWRAISEALPTDAIISSDIGNNCAIGNAYPSFEEGRKYLAPGHVRAMRLWFSRPSWAQKSPNPDVPVVGFAGDGAFGISMNEMTACGREGVAGHHHDHFP